MVNRAKQHRASVFLVDDHALVREHLIALIREEADLQVCGEAADAATALRLIRQQSPELVTLDLSLKRSNGLDLLKELQGLRPKPEVLVLSMHDERLYVEQALQGGARGYITKQDATVNILRAIRRVLSGRMYLSERLADQLAGRPMSAEALVAAELPV